MKETHTYFTVEELEAIDRRARVMFSSSSNPDWKESYKHLSLACQMLKNRIMKSTIKEGEPNEFTDDGH